MAGIELSVLSKHCLPRRLPSERDLTTEIVAWDGVCNKKQAKIYWNFIVDKAREVFLKNIPIQLSLVDVLVSVDIQPHKRFL